MSLADITRTVGWGAKPRKERPVAVHVKFSETLPLRASEWFLSFIMVTWATLVLVNPDMFTKTGNFTGMLVMFPQNIWGWSAITTGVCGLAALGINGFWRATPFIRALCALTRCFIWFQITLGLFIGGNVSTGLAIYPWLTIFEMWNIYRAMKDARQVF